MGGECGGWGHFFNTKIGVHFLRPLPCQVLFCLKAAAGFRKFWGIVWNWFFMRKRTHDMSFWSQNCACFCCVITVVEARTSRVMTHLHFEFWCCRDSGSMSWSQLRVSTTKVVEGNLTLLGPSTFANFRCNLVSEKRFSVSARYAWELPEKIVERGVCEEPFVFTVPLPVREPRVRSVISVWSTDCQYRALRKATES